jgi:AAA ATPase domain
MAIPKVFPPNPFRPGAGHVPPHLAGREGQKQKFADLLGQNPVMKNLLITGLRGVGKTVLLDPLKNIAINAGWKWVGTEMSESACVSEATMATRLLADLSTATSGLVLELSRERYGFTPSSISDDFRLDHGGLRAIYDGTPGLPSDKIIGAIRLGVSELAKTNVKGVVFAYDEAQNLSDKADDDQYPTSVLLDVFQRLQREGLPVLLLLTGLPTLFPRLVEARTYSERLFTIEMLQRLSSSETKEAINKPMNDVGLHFAPAVVDAIVQTSGGYPYFVQFICRELYDLLDEKNKAGAQLTFSMDEIIKKLDNDFYSGRWNTLTDGQKDLLRLVAAIPGCDGEFTILQIDEVLKKAGKEKDKSSINKSLKLLADRGMVYKDKHGKYCLAVPMLTGFIKRQAVKA